MASPTPPAALKAYWDAVFGGAREDINRQLLEVMTGGRSFVKMVTGAGHPRHKAWEEIFKWDPPGGLPYEEEPVLFGFGQGADTMKSETDLLALWDRLPAPESCTVLESAIGDVQTLRMFYAMVGPPRAYFEVPIDSDQEGGSVARVVYRVLGYTKLMGPDESLQSAEPELVRCLWADIKNIRLSLEREGHDDPVLFWRRRPELSEQTEPGSLDRIAMLTIRVAIPGYDWAQCYSLGGNGEMPPRVCSERDKAVRRHAALVEKLSKESAEAADRHLVAYHKLIGMRYPQQDPPILVDKPGLYGAGQLAAVNAHGYFGQRPDGSPLLNNGGRK